MAYTKVRGPGLSLGGPRGPQGLKGDKPAYEVDGVRIRWQNPDGTWGDWIDLDNVLGFNFRADWAAGVAYDLNDLVTYGNAVYVARRDSTGVEPGTSSADWALFVPGGTVGDGAITEPKLASTLSNVLARVVATRAELKALNTSTFKTAYLTEEDREGTFIWRTGDFTAQLASDGFEGIYIKADAVPITEGCWVRKMTDARYHMDWFGARLAADIKPIFDKVKLLAAGATLVFGAATYTTSDTLAYEGADNKGCWITGVSAEETRIENQGTGFTIKYYGVQGGGNEARGGGVFRLSCAKQGVGKCNGIEVANVYRGAIKWCETTECGGIGISVGGRGGGDYDATFGLTISKNRCRDGDIGLRIKPEESGALQAAQIDIVDNNFDGNATTGIWLAGFDQVLVRNNTLTVCGHGTGGRGNVFVEQHGIIPRNLRLEQNEIGNNLPATIFMVVVDAIQTMQSRMNRFVRNAGEGGDYFFYLGLTSNAGVLNDIRLDGDYLIAVDSTPAAVYVAFGGSNKTLNNPVEIHNPAPVFFDEAYHSYHLTGDSNKVLFVRGDRDRRQTRASVSTTGSGTVTVSTDLSLHHRVFVNGTGATTITVSGAARAGDLLMLEYYNSSGGAVTITMGAGFQGVAPPAVAAIQTALFRYRSDSAVWQQLTAWAQV